MSENQDKEDCEDFERWCRERSDKESIKVKMLRRIDYNLYWRLKGFCKTNGLKLDWAVEDSIKAWLDNKNNE